MAAVFLGCSKENGLNNTNPIDASNLNIIIKQENYNINESITRSPFGEETILFKDNVDCGNGLNAEITFYDKTETLPNNHKTRIAGDTLVGMSDADYVIFAYDNNGECKDYLKFTLSNGNITFTADQQLIEGKPNGYGNNTELVADGTLKYVCLRLVTGVEPDYSTGIITFKQVDDADWENFYISDFVEKQLSETDNTLSFTMRRQVACIRVMVNAIDPNITGNIGIGLLTDKNVCSKLKYEIEATSTSEYPENIVISSDSTQTITSHWNLSNIGNEFITSLSEDPFPYHAYKDFYFLAEPDLEISTKIKIQLRNIKDNGIEWISSYDYLFDPNSKASYDTRKFLRANRRYYLHINLYLMNTYEKHEITPYVSQNNNEKFFQWDAYSHFVNGTYGNWGAGNEDFHSGNITSTEQSAKYCPTEDDIKKYIGAGSVWDDEGFIFAIGVSDGVWHNWVRDASGSALQTSMKGIWLQKSIEISSDVTPAEKGTPFKMSELTDEQKNIVRLSGNLFFLPAAGQLVGQPGVSFSHNEYNESGYYWSSTMTYNDNINLGKALFFNSNTIEIREFNREIGMISASFEDFQYR